MRREHASEAFGSHRRLLSLPSAAFLSSTAVLPLIRNGSLRKKYDALKYTLKKMENTLYELSLTESGVSKPEDFPASAIEVQGRIWVCPNQPVACSAAPRGCASSLYVLTPLGTVVW